MTNSAYDELVERCVRAAIHEGGGGSDRGWIGVTEAILAEVARTLENVTSEMDDAWDLPGWEIDETAVARTFLAMLRASPLFPPDKEPPR